jgi:hypothetical protein
MKSLYLLLLLFTSSNLTACNSNKSNSLKVLPATNSKSSLTTGSMKIKITIGEKVVTAILYNNPASLDFASLLPLELNLEDYNKTEKISDLPKKLSTKEAPAGYKPLVGDITLYAPWGNLAIFYKDFSYSNGLISLGKITTGIEALSVSGPLKAKIELDNN